MTLPNEWKAGGLDFENPARERRFRVGITVDDARGIFNIYVTNHTDGVRYVLEPTKIVFTRTDEGMMAQPVVTCSWEYGIPLLKALRDAINRFDEEMGGVLG